MAILNITQELFIISYCTFWIYWMSYWLGYQSNSCSFGKPPSMHWSKAQDVSVSGRPWVPRGSLGVMFLKTCSLSWPLTVTALKLVSFHPSWVCSTLCFNVLRLNHVHYNDNSHLFIGGLIETLLNWIWLKTEFMGF